MKIELGLLFMNTEVEYKGYKRHDLKPALKNRKFEPIGLKINTGTVNFPAFTKSLSISSVGVFLDGSLIHVNDFPMVQIFNPGDTLDIRPFDISFYPFQLKNPNQEQ